MKKLFYRISTVGLILLIIGCTISAFINVSNAVYNFNFSSNVSEAKKGETITLTITANGLTGNVRLSASNATLSDSQKWVEKNNVTITATLTAFPAKITATPVELTDDEYNIVSLSSKTVTINEKIIQAPSSESTTQTPSNSGTSNNKPSQGGTQTTSGIQTASKNNTPTQTSQNAQVKSSNNYLKSLSVNVGTLSPEFYRETFDYRVDNIIENEIEIMAEAENEKSTINGTGKVSLNDGENKINIEVIAENGSSRLYTVTINKIYKIIQSDLRLDTLKLDKINEKGEFFGTSIDFNPEKFEYELEVEEDITDINVLTTVSKEGIIVETSGTNNLQEGKNTATILLTNQNDTTMKTIYTIIINKNAKKVIEVSTVNKKINKWQITGTIIFILLIIFLIGMLIFYYFKKRK